jgi:hypothetical protein
MRYEPRKMRRSSTTENARRRMEREVDGDTPSKQLRPGQIRRQNLTPQKQRRIA